MKTYKVVVQPKQHYQSKMTPDELQEHLKMCRLALKPKKKNVVTLKLSTLNAIVKRREHHDS